MRGRFQERSDLTPLLGYLSAVFGLHIHIAQLPYITSIGDSLEHTED